MHLSLLSDAIFSDLLDDAGCRERARAARKGAARQHLDGVMRGVIFATALLTPFALTFVPAAFGHGHPASVDGVARP